MLLLLLGIAALFPCCLSAVSEQSENTKIKNYTIGGINGTKEQNLSSNFAANLWTTLHQYCSTSVYSRPCERMSHVHKRISTANPQQDLRSIYIPVDSTSALFGPGGVLLILLYRTIRSGRAQDCNVDPICSSDY